MKYAPMIIWLAFLGWGCAPEAEDGTIPAGLEEKQNMLREKRAELKKLTGLVAELETAIAQQDPNRRANEGRLVATAPVERADFRHYVEIQGAVAADDLVSVTSEIAGRIIELTVEEGDNVNRGQLVATLDTEQMQRQYEEIETQLDLASTVFERQKRLWDKNIGSEMQFLEAKNNKERLEKSMETLRVQLSKAKIYAPLSGVVETVNLKSGEVASPGVPIVQILNTSRLKVEADVPENYLRAVKPGEEVTLYFPALDREQTERVNLIGRTIDPANRTFKVEARVHNSDGLLKPNLLATMKINDFSLEDVVIIPLETVQEEVSGKKFVFVVDQGESGPVAKKVYVNIGQSYEGQVVIQNGLNGDETLILDGGRGLVDEQPIQIVEGKTQASNG